MSQRQRLRIPSNQSTPSAIAKPALTLSQELGIPLVKDCEELLAKIQDDLGE
jgi:hypothetical protein